MSSLDDLVRKMQAMGPAVPTVASIRMHPATLKRLKEVIPQAAGPFSGLEAFTGIALIGDDQIAVGWLHEHDGKGRLIRRVPPISVQRTARN